VQVSTHFSFVGAFMICSRANLMDADAVVLHLPWRCTASALALYCIQPQCLHVVVCGAAGGVCCSCSQPPPAAAV
jgi:hypothetical protein